MLDWKKLAEEYDALVHILSDPGLEQRVRATHQKRSSLLNTLLDLHRQIEGCDKVISDSTLSLEQENSDMRELYEQEIADAAQQKLSFERELEDMLYPSDPKDDRSVFVEIRAGAGGQEAALFAGNLIRMYSNYAIRKGWQVSVVEESSTDLGGYKEVIIHVQGKRVYKYLKFESGVHRVQRVPKTEAAGRIHTSTVSVAILPIRKKTDVSNQRNWVIFLPARSAPARVPQRPR